MSITRDAVTIDSVKIEAARNENRLDRIASQIMAASPEQQLTEIKAAAVFAHVYRGELRYNTTSDSYFYYNGKYWQRDLGSVHARAMAKEFARLMINYALSIENDACFKFYAKYNSKRYRDSLLADAQTENHLQESDFDKNPDLLNVANGTLNLKTFTLQAHNPDDLLTNYCDTEYSEGARSELWERFIVDIFPGDGELRQYVQKALAYGMTGKPELERMFILYGQSTRNGKSTLLNAVSAVLGTYSSNTPPEMLQRRVKDSAAPSEDLARLNQTRFLTVAEPDRGMILDVALIKRLIGRDVITARRLRENSFEYIPKFAMYMNTNYLPRVFDETLFTSRRVEVIPFNRHFSESEEDITLKAKLSTKESRSAILSWLIEGLKDFRENGLQAPLAVRTITRVYEQNSDKLQRYIDSRLEESERPELTVKDCYADYVDWCRSEGYTAEGKLSFSDRLRTKNMILPTATVNGRTTRNVIGKNELGTITAYKLSK